MLRVFSVRLVVWPELFGPAPAGAAVVAGAVLVLAAVLLAMKRLPFRAAMACAVVCWLLALVQYVPHLVTSPRDGMAWTNLGKGLALPSALILAAEAMNRSRRVSGDVGVFLIAFFLGLGGIQHILYAPFVATLIPDWIPAHLFWTYFTAGTLILASIGLALPRTRTWAATWAGWMIFIWTWLLHLPRALAAGPGSNETTAFFEALALAAACFLIARRADRKTAVEDLRREEVPVANR